MLTVKRDGEASWVVGQVLMDRWSCLTSRIKRFSESRTGAFHVRMLEYLDKDDTHYQERLEHHHQISLEDSQKGIPRRH